MSLKGAYLNHSPLTRSDVRWTNSGSSMFSDARDVYNHSSTLNSVAGDIHYHNYSALKGHGLPGGGTAASRQSELPSQLYSRLLMREGRGYPLFEANLPNELPEEYQSSGVMIGDVGLVMPDGYFDVLFNICEPADGSINGGCVPDGFVTLERPSQSRHNYRRGRSSDSGAWIASDAVEVASQQTRSGLYDMACGPGEGAVLLLPEGALREDLLCREDFLDYASKHGVSWYEFANARLKRGVANGAMYLITGFDKANTWGTASFISSEITPRFRMCFKQGLWDDPGRASTRKGPEGGGTRLENQCLFLRGYKVTLNNKVLTNIFGVRVVEASPLGDLTQGSTEQSVSLPFPSIIGLLSIWRSITGSSEAGMITEEKLREMPVITSTEAKLSPVRIGLVDLLHSLIEFPWKDIHPSNILNMYLLSNVPEADLAITHDSVWCSYLEEQQGSIQNNESLLDHLNSEYAIRKDGKAAYFVKRTVQESQDIESSNEESLRSESHIGWPGSSAFIRLSDGEMGDIGCTAHDFFSGTTDLLLEGDLNLSYTIPNIIYSPPELCADDPPIPSLPNADPRPVDSASLSPKTRGCWTCRLRRKKCDGQREDGSCRTCRRLTINCLGWSPKRPEWMHDKRAVETYKAEIKEQLVRKGLIRGQPRRTTYSQDSIHAGPSRTRRASTPEH